MTGAGDLPKTDLIAAHALGAQCLDLPLPALRRRRPAQLAPSTAEDGEQLGKHRPKAPEAWLSPETQNNETSSTLAAAIAQEGDL